MKIGLTGNIGSGKSLASKYLQNMGYEVINADEVSRQCMLPNTPCNEEVKKHFGAEYFDEYSNLNRKKMADLVFNDRVKLQELNNISHKYVFLAIDELVEKANSPHIFVESAIIYESNWQEAFEQVWLITADDEVRKKRVMVRDNITIEQVEARIASQMSQEEKIKRADVIIENNDWFVELEEKLFMALEKLA